MSTSYSRGWPIFYDGTEWRYKDNGQAVDMHRPCKRCGKAPTIEGFDYCIGKIDGVVSACCGHGITKPILLYERKIGKNMGNNEGVSLGVVKVIHKTKKAILVHANDFGEIWVPEDVVHADSEIYLKGNSTTGELVVFLSFAEKKGWV